MGMSRKAIIAVSTTALTFGAVTPAQAAEPQVKVLAAGESSSDWQWHEPDAYGSVTTGDKWWDGLHWTLKFLVVVASAALGVTALGMLRTLVYNLAGS